MASPSLPQDKKLNGGFFAGPSPRQNRGQNLRSCSIWASRWRALAKSLALAKRALSSLPLEWVLAKNLERREGYFAGDDQERLDEFQTALSDPKVRIIWCARGGYGSTRILHRLEGSSDPNCKKLIVGFSDVTALLAWNHQLNRSASIHGPVLAQIAELDEDSRSRLVDFLEGNCPPPLMTEGGTAVYGGRVEGPLFAANVEVLRSLVGTPFFPDLRGKILALEEIGERPYRIDRALTQLIQSGSLRGLKGIAIGDLQGCEDPRELQDYGPDALSVMLERLETLRVPILTGFPFGHHGQRNAALPIGRKVALDVEAGALEFLEPLFQD